MQAKNESKMEKQKSAGVRALGVRTPSEFASQDAAQSDLARVKTAVA